MTKKMTTATAMALLLFPKLMVLLAKYDNGEKVAVAPMDFERDLEETIAAWNLGGCRVENYSTCLPRALVMVGGILTRYTFAPCSRVMRWKER